MIFRDNTEPLSSSWSETETAVFYCDLENPQAVTAVDDELFVVEERMPVIFVMNKCSVRTMTRHIDIPGLQDPEDLAGCAHNKALYISDSWLHCINRVDLTINSVTSWEMSKGYNPWGLSVTAEHNLLVTVQIKVTKGESRVVEYTTEGQQVREIRLDESIKYARYTVQLYSDQYVVCHWQLEEGGYQHRLYVINCQGEIIKSYGGERGECKGRLNEPDSIAVDSERQCVFVADSHKHRVLVFDYDLNYLGQVHMPPGPRKLLHVFFDSACNTLYISGYTLYM